MEVDWLLADPAKSMHNIERALMQFEGFCIVTESARAGGLASVSIRDGQGHVVHAVAPKL